MPQLSILSITPPNTLLALAIGAALNATLPSAHAIGLGQAELRSRLGEPLRLVMPVRLEEGEALTSTCVALVSRDANDGIPSISSARIDVQTDAGGAKVVIATRQLMNEPAIRVTIRAGCADVMTREFVFLLDPPIAPEPQAAFAGNDASIAPVRPSAARTRGQAVSEPNASANAGGAATAKSDATKSTASPKPRTARAAPKKPAVGPAQPSKLATAPATASTSDAPRKESKSAPAKADRGDRMRLAEPERTGSSALRLDSALSDAKALPAQDLARLQQDRARTRALLLDQAPAPSAREAELTRQLAAVGAEIQALKQQMALESARNQAANRSVPNAWLYVIGILAAAFGATAVYLLNQNRRMKRVLKAAPWWLDTKLRMESPRGQAPRDEPDYDDDLAEPVSSFVTPSTAGATAMRIDTAADKATPYPLNVDVQFPDRLQDATIEVEELGATQALRMFEPRRAGAETTRTTPHVDGPRSGTPTEAKAQEPLHLSAVDIDLDVDVVAAREDDEVEISQHRTLPELERTVRNAVLDAPNRPEWMVGIDEGMSWNDARQAQAWLREVAEAIEQAEAFLAASQYETAASTMRRLIQARDSVPPAPWLLLLSIYRRMDKRDEYDVLAAKFRDKYGRAAPVWSSSATPPADPGLDNDPELLQSIWAKWGSPDSMALLSRLLYDTQASDERFFNLVLQRDLLNFVKICPLEA